MSRLRTWLRTALAYAMPAYLVLVATLVVIGVVMPWAPGRAALARAYPGQSPILVGVASETRRRPGHGVDTVATRYYVLVPAVLREGQLVSVQRGSDGTVQLGRTRAGFFALLAMLLACLAGTAYFWFWPSRER